MKLASLPSTMISAKPAPRLFDPLSRALPQPLPPSGDRRHTCNNGRPNGSPRCIKVLLVDDHPVVRKGLASCLAQHEHLAIAGEAANGLEAIAKARELLPDVVVLDIDMPCMNGLAATEVLRKELPRVKVLVLSMYQRPEYLRRILQSGAQGYVLKEAAPDELVRAIETVNAGEAYFSPEIARDALNQFIQGNGKGADLSALTPREQEVLALIATGLSNKEIACSLGVGVRTAETHRERTMRKLDIHSVAGLTRFAIAKGLISLRDETVR